MRGAGAVRRRADDEVTAPDRETVSEAATDEHDEWDDRRGHRTPRGRCASCCTATTSRRGSRCRSAVGRRVAQGPPADRVGRGGDARRRRSTASTTGGLDLLILDGEAGKAGGHRPVPPAQGRDLPLPAGPAPASAVRRTPWLRLVAEPDAVVTAPARPARPAARPSPACSRGRPETAAMTESGADGAADLAAPARPACIARRGPRPPTRRRWAMDQVMARRGDARCSSPGSSSRCAPRARPSPSSPAWPRRCSRTRAGSRCPGRAVDVVGTGGDLTHTVNISTMAALVVAGTGVRVVKHGNRAASSSTGTADVLEALGLRLDQTPERVAELAEEVGHHLLLRAGVPPVDAARRRRRARELGVPTAFNFLGPLTNPAQPAAAAIGCRRPRGWPRSWPACSRRAGRRALVFRGHGGPRRARGDRSRRRSGGCATAR